MDGNLSNLSSAGAGTKPRDLEEPEAVRAHILDRIAGWAAWTGLAGFAVLAFAFRGRIGSMVEAGGWPLVIALAVTLSVGASAGIFLWIISPAIGAQNRELGHHALGETLQSALREHANCP